MKQVKKFCFLLTALGFGIWRLFSTSIQPQDREVGVQSLLCTALNTPGPRSGVQSFAMHSFEQDFL